MLFRIGLNKIKILSLLLLLSSCAKDDDVLATLEDGKSTVIYDLAGDTKASMSNGVDGKERREFYTFLFKLENKRQIWLHTAADSTRWMKSKEWDLAFSGPYNSIFWVNNATQIGNPGFEGSSDKTAIILMRQSYESLTTAPSDEAFDNSSIVSIGQADDGQSAGWYSYNSATHVMQTYSNRTYAIRLPDGKYAKLQMLSVYKGNPPSITDMYWPAPYLTFRYFVQKDGSRDLKTN